jgi:hypothetical protein
MRVDTDSPLLGVQGKEMKMNTVYIKAARNQALDMIYSLPACSLGICGERQGVIAIETVNPVQKAMLESMAGDRLTDESEFFSAASVLYEARNWLQGTQTNLPEYIEERGYLRVRDEITDWISEQMPVSERAVGMAIDQLLR